MDPVKNPFSPGAGSPPPCLMILCEEHYLSFKQTKYNHSGVTRDQVYS